MMTTDDKIKDEKLQHDIDKEAAKILALSSGKIDQYEYLTGEEILTYNQSRIIEQSKCIYSPLGKAFEKQIKAIEGQGIKQVEALKALKPVENKENIKPIEGIFPKEMRTNEIKNETDQIKKWEEKNKRKNLICKVNKCKYDFQQYETIRSFGESIYTGKINTDKPEMDQGNLLKNLVEFNDRSSPETEF